MTHVLLLIRSLEAGGAEKQLVELARGLHKRGIMVTVVIFYSGGFFEKRLINIGVSVVSLEKKGRWDTLGWFLRYLKVLRDLKPDVVYSFLTVSNILACLGNVFKKIPVVWGIRASNMKLENYDWTARLTSWMEKKLSPFVSTIIFNSQFGKKHHQEIGYILKNPVVVPNGIDTDQFYPDIEARVNFREKLRIPQDAFVVGMIARVDPMKDYGTFMKAMQSLSSKDDNLHFVIAGKGTDTVSWNDCPKNLHALGVVENMREVFSSLDVMVLSSFGEGFPNAIGEAMACGIPVIATDVGDSSFLIEDLGIIIPVGDSIALAEAIIKLKSAKKYSKVIRQRIIDNFSTNRMIDKTMDTLQLVVMPQ